MVKWGTKDADVSSVTKLYSQQQAGKSLIDVEKSFPGNNKLIEYCEWIKLMLN